MLKELTCIECPKGCRLSVEYEEGNVLKVTGNQCPKGEAYGRQEIEHPLRILTTTVLTKNLEFKMLPVKTSQPIPKEKVVEGMARIKKILVTEPVLMAGVIEKNFLGLAVDLIATRPCGVENG